MQTSVELKSLQKVGFLVPSPKQICRYSGGTRGNKQVIRRIYKSEIPQIKEECNGDTLRVYKQNIK